MIVYGLTMQGKNEEVPAEVAAWLLERNSHYLNTIDFTVDVDDVVPEYAAEYEPMARKYSRFFHHNAPMGGILSVTFPYRTQSWRVKIVGGTNEKGEIADPSEEQTRKPLSAKQRAEIAGWDMGSESINEMVTAILRQPGDPLKDYPTQMVTLPADGHWTSEASMTGAELDEILANPQTSKQASQAILRKDWAALKKLNEQRDQ